MKLGICYNAFDGLELLEKSATTMRKADYIGVLYQTVSNLGIDIKEDPTTLLKDLLKRGIINEAILYQPDPKLGPHGNEIKKRQLGHLMCVRQSCDWTMSMDLDEFYTADLFKQLERADKEGYCSIFAQMQTYYRKPTMKLSPPEEYYVAVAYKTMNRNYSFQSNVPVLVDPTRRMMVQKPLICKREELEMHHMSYIRKDMLAKLESSSASTDFKTRIPQINEWYQNWHPGQNALLAGGEERFYDLVETEDLFGLSELEWI